MIVRLWDKIEKIVNPLEHARKHGMKVGKGVRLSSKNGTTFGSEPYLITLEDEVLLSGNVHFITHDGGTWPFRDMDKYKDHGVDIATFGSIVVGKRSFIGYGATILPGVKIGERCVIGAGAVVTHDIPAYSVAVGVPARVIKSTWEYADSCMQKHMEKHYDLVRLQNDRDRYLMEMNAQGLL